MERFHFEPAFDAQPDPEFPGDGVWPCPVHGYDRDGAIQPDFSSVWGSPFVVEVALDDGRRWVGQYAAGGLGGETGAFATPDPFALCVVVGGQAYLTDVRSPEAGAAAMSPQVRQVAAVADVPLLLLVTDIDIVALGAEGAAWKTPRIAVDDLRVLSADARGIVCSLDNLGGTATITLDPMTGEQIDGTRMDSFWPPGAR